MRRKMGKSNCGSACDMKKEKRKERMKEDEPLHDFVPKDGGCCLF